MPNYIRNKLIIIGSEADIKTVIDNCKYGHEIEMYTVEQEKKRDKRQ